MVLRTLLLLRIRVYYSIAEETDRSTNSWRSGFFFYILKAEISIRVSAMLLQGSRWQRVRRVDVLSPLMWLLAVNDNLLKLNRDADDADVLVEQKILETH